MRGVDSQLQTRLFLASSALTLLAACASPTERLTSLPSPEETSVAQLVALSPSWRAVDATTGQISAIGELELLALNFPNSASVRLRLLNAHLGAGNLDDASRVARSLVEEGYSFSREGLARLTEALGEDPDAAWLAASDANGVAIGASEIYLRFPPQAGLVEDLVIVDGRYAIATSVEGAIWFRPGLHVFDGSYPVTLPDHGNLTGIVTNRNGAVVGSGNLGLFGVGEDAFSGLIAFGDRRWTPVHIPAPRGAQISDLAITRDQIVYASDPLNGGIYAWQNGSDRMTELVAPGTLRSPQGIAPAADGMRLYVSDYRYGLAIVDTRTGEVSRLVTDTPMLLDGIDGLWLHEGELIAMQNGISPKRIVALRLADNGNRITSLRVLEQAHPDWTEPLGGDLHQGALYYIGNGSWDLIGEDGAYVERVKLRPAEVRVLPLSTPASPDP